jgi:hypothetical protein
LPHFGLVADDPARVVPTPSFNDGDSFDAEEGEEELVGRIAGTFRVVTGPERAARYLCTVAAGIASPHDTAISSSSSSNNHVATATAATGTGTATFRPHSSRDAHIMLQLKRTLDVTDGPMLSALIRSALEAGKNCRNDQVVPAIRPLRKYSTGSEKSSGRYGSLAGPAPSHLVLMAVQQARDKAIEPAVRRYCEMWTAQSASCAIAELHRAVTDLVVEKRRRKQASQQNGVAGPNTSSSPPPSVRQLLHSATVTLRRGGTVRIDDVLEEVSRLLRDESK